VSHVSHTKPQILLQTSQCYIISQKYHKHHESHKHHSTHRQPFYGSLDFVRNNPGEPVPENHSTTHIHHGHQSSLICFLYMLRSSVQFTCLTVFFHNLSPGPLWSTSWPGTLHFILHTFLHPIIVFFSQHTPIPLQPVLL